MDDLPVVVLQEILDFLSIQEKMRSKLICKKFKFVVETFCTQQNVYIYSRDYPYKGSWCWSDQQIADEDMLHLRSDLQTSRPFDLRMEFFRNLQKVCLDWVGEKTDQFLEEVHLLSKLKVLMVKGQLDKTTLRTLSSSSLEKLTLNSGDLLTPVHLELDTPNLSSVDFFWMNYRQIVFLFPLMVKRFKCCCSSPCLNRLKNLETLICRHIYSDFKLKNLETLICQKITSDFKLNDFKSLTRLEVFPFNENDLQAVRQILDQRKRLERDRPEMFICGFKEQLPTCGKIYELMDGLQPEYIEYVVQNYSKLVGTFPWTFSFDIRNLLKYGNLIPQDFFEKFTGICYISCETLANLTITESEQRVLIEHIKRSSVRSLSIERLDMSLKREFYEQLSTVQSLRFLQIGPHLENVEFDHFLKLKHLHTFRIKSTQKIPVEFVSKLFVELKNLKEFRLRATSDEKCEFKIDIFFNESQPDEEEAWPYEFQCYLPDVHKDEPILFDYCDNANQLAQSIKQMKDDERLMPFLI